MSGFFQECFIMGMYLSLDDVNQLNVILLIVSAVFIAFYLLFRTKFRLFVI